MKLGVFSSLMCIGTIAFADPSTISVSAQQVETSALLHEFAKVSTPTSTLSVASSGLSVLVDLGCVDPDAELHYTLDGSEPTAESPIYSKPFYAFDAETLKVVAVKNDFANSDILVKDIAIYCVVDLSGGSDALSYPVSYIVGVPSGGWTDEYKTTKLVLRKINAGSFIMGEDQTNEDHRVTLTKPFYMGVFEVTQKQWSLVMGSNPAKDNGVGDAYPVYYVSYEMIRGSLTGAQWPVSASVDDASFVGKLQSRSGVVLDLPTEAQWEYACRAGTTSIYYWGDSMNGDYAWHSDNSGNLTHVVGSKIPNDFSLYDMSGNAWEWCLDWADALMFGVDPVGCSTGANRIQRGGAIGHADMQGFSSSGRAMDRPPSQIAKDFGLRIAMASNYPKRPAISPTCGTTFDTSLTVSMTCASEDATIHFTTNGTVPTMESATYSRKFKIYGKTTVKAIAFCEDGTASEMAVAEYSKGHCATPVIAAQAEFMGSKQRVDIACATEGATLYYTTDGQEPDSHSPKYTKPFYVTDTTTVKAYATKADYFDSAIATFAIAKAWGIGDTMGKPDHAFATSGAKGFVRVEDATATLGESMKSGAIADDEKSILSTTVIGPGTLTFKWKASCEEDDEYEWDHGEFRVNGAPKAWINGVTDWIEVSQRIDGEGTNTVTWTYVKDGVESVEQDCIWVSDYTWASDYTTTQTTEVPVPYDWLRQKSRDIVDEYDNYEKVAKQAAYNRRFTVEQCYVAGLDPESTTNDFTSAITMEGTLPKINWTPDLGVERLYKIWGKEALEDGYDWEYPTNALHRFFKVTVEMPK